MLVPNVKLMVFTTNDVILCGLFGIHLFYCYGLGVCVFTEFVPLGEGRCSTLFVFFYNLFCGDGS